MGLVWTARSSRRQRVRAASWSRQVVQVRVREAVGVRGRSRRVWARRQKGCEQREMWVGPEKQEVEGGAGGVGGRDGGRKWQPLLPWPLLPFAYTSSFASAIASHWWKF